MEHTINLNAGDNVRLIVSEAGDTFTISMEIGPSEEMLEQVPIEHIPEIDLHLVPLNFTDIIATLPTNPNPIAPKAWWVRTKDKITGITIHHTGAATARQCAQSHVNRGRPSIEYHLFVGFDGVVYRCLHPLVGCWHDHAGHYNKNLSIALAGYHHKSSPLEVQLVSLVRTVAWAMTEYDVPIENVMGHHERALLVKVATDCPGWHLAGWRDAFFNKLRMYL